MFTHIPLGTKPSPSTSTNASLPLYGSMSPAVNIMVRCGKTRVLGLTLVTLLLIIITMVYVYTGFDCRGVLYRPINEGRREHTKNNTTGHVHGYILTLQFTGQQIAGVRGIFSQQCWVAAFNLSVKIVEPFMVDSYLIHSKQLWDTTRTQFIQTFSDFYDMTYYNQQSQEDGRPVLVKWTTFLTNAPRKVILLNIEYIFKRDCLNFKSESACQHTTVITSHSQYTSGCWMTNNVVEAINYLKSHGFEVVREVCLNCGNGRPPFKPEDIVKYIFGEWDPNEVVLIVNRWKFSIQMTPECKANGIHDTECYKPELGRLQPGPRLLADAQQYINTVKHNKKRTSVVAIMIRIEWFLIMYKNKSLATVRDCLSKVISQLKQLTKPDKPVSPTLALDIGRFGSGTFNVTLSKQGINGAYFELIISEIKQFLEDIHDDRLGFEEWEQTYLDVVGKSGDEDRGYIAALQSTIASEADCLIQMGGGHYQQLAWIQYLHNHPDERSQCVHHICMPQPFQQL